MVLGTINVTLNQRDVTIKSTPGRRKGRMHQVQGELKKKIRQEHSAGGAVVTNLVYRVWVS